jgi:predicted CoA-substrate-specific enzyme activase
MESRGLEKLEKEDKQMITAGVDSGLMNTKVVILDDGTVVAKASGSSGGAHRSKSIENIWHQSLKEAGLDASDVQQVVATGQGKTDVFFADKAVVDAVADARAARFLYPDSTAVVDVGADQTRVVALGDGNKINETVTNQKCMAGLGLILEIVADRLGMSFAEISLIDSEAGKNTPVNDGCPVFAEQGALELLNRGVGKADVIGAVTDVVAIRINSILHDKFYPDKEKTVLFGGIAKNDAVVSRLKLRSGIDFLIPEDSEYGAALGAAVIAAEQPI